jgi:hypothetical protein
LLKSYFVVGFENFILFEFKNVLPRSSWLFGGGWFQNPLATFFNTQTSYKYIENLKLSCNVALVLKFLKVIV